MPHRNGWNIVEFIEYFTPHVAPELLVNIFVSALECLEYRHRRGFVHGTLRPAHLWVSSSGEVDVRGWGEAELDPAARRFQAPELSRGERPTPASDVHSLTAIISTLMPEGMRVHPQLRKLLAESLATRATGAWALKAKYLDFLTRMGIEGEPFFVERFVSDPVAYNRSLTVVLAEREYRHIRYLNNRGRRRQAMTELHFLLEITPVNRQALNLWRTVKEGRRRALAHTAYAALIGAVLLISGSVISEKLNLPFGSREPVEANGTKALLIDLADQQLPGTAQGRASRRPGSSPDTDASHSEPAHQPGQLELGLTDRALPRRKQPGKGAVILDIDDDARAYFNGAAGQVRGHKDGAQVWLPPGSHLVTVVKPGFPPAFATFALRAGRAVELSGRAVTR